MPAWVTTINKLCHCEHSPVTEWLPLVKLVNFTNLKAPRHHGSILFIGNEKISVGAL